MTAIVTIVINAVNNASKQIEGVNKSMGSVLGTMGNVAGAAAIAGLAIKEAFDFGKEGAQLDLTSERFERLAESIGMTSDALMHDLSAATGGMVSNAEQMALANQLISLGLADTGEEVTRLARLITENGWDMQQVILTFANNSKMRLDALGLSVTDVEARTKKFIEQGMSMDQAFDLAVIEAGEEKLRLVGSAADSGVGSFERLEAITQNMTDTFKRWIADGLLPAVDAAVLLATWQDKLREASDQAVEATQSGAATYEDYVAQLEKIGVESGRVTLTQEDLAKGYANGSIQATVFKNALVILTKEAWEQNKAMGTNADTLETIHANMQMAAYTAQEYSTAALDVSEKTRDWAENTFYAAQALELQADNTYLAYVNSEKFADRLQLVNDKAVEMTDALHNAQPPVEQLLDTLDQDISSPLSQFIDDLQFFIASGGQDFQGTFQAIKEALASNQITAEEAQSFSGELLASIENVKVAAGEITLDEAAQNIADTLNVSLEDALKLLQDVGTAADVLTSVNREISMDTSPLESAYDLMMSIEDSVDNITGSHNVHFNITTSGAVPSLGGAGSTPDANKPGAAEAKAAGGPVSPNSWYLVGEQGPEFFKPNTAGNIIPADQTAAIMAGGGGGGVMIQNLNIYANSSNPMAIAQQVSVELGRQVRQMAGGTRP